MSAFDAEDFEAFESVEPVFQAIVQQVGPSSWLDPAVLGSQPAPIRMLLATRAVEALIDNGGWVAVFVEEQEALLPVAIEGWRFLGLDHHAAMAERIRNHGFDLDAEEDEVWDEFDAEWRALSSAERARAAYIRDHPTDFTG